MRRELIRNHEASGDDIHKHLRMGMLGEHRKKLRLETIEKLAQIFNESLFDLNYLS